MQTVERILGHSGQDTLKLHFAWSSAFIWFIRHSSQKACKHSNSILLPSASFTSAHRPQLNLKGGNLSYFLNSSLNCWALRKLILSTISLILISNECTLLAFPTTNSWFSSKLQRHFI